MTKAEHIKAQIKAINRQIQLGKYKNIHSTNNKIKTLKIRLNEELERERINNYLSQ